MIIIIFVVIKNNTEGKKEENNTINTNTLDNKNPGYNDSEEENKTTEEYIEDLKKLKIDDTVQIDDNKKVSIQYIFDVNENVDENFGNVDEDIVVEYITKLTYNGKTIDSFSNNFLLKKDSIEEFIKNKNIPYMMNKEKFYSIDNGFPYYYFVNNYVGGSTNSYLKVFNSNGLELGNFINSSSTLEVVQIKNSNVTNKFNYGDDEDIFNFTIIKNNYIMIYGIDEAIKENNFDSINEYKIIIENNKLNYTFIKNYDNIQVSGGI